MFRHPQKSKPATPGFFFSIKKSDDEKTSKRRGSEMCAVILDRGYSGRFLDHTQNHIHRDRNGKNCIQQKKKKEKNMERRKINKRHLTNTGC